MLRLLLYKDLAENIEKLKDMTYRDGEIERNEEIASSSFCKIGI